MTTLELLDVGVQKPPGDGHLLRCMALHRDAPGDQWSAKGLSGFGSKLIITVELLSGDLSRSCRAWARFTGYRLRLQDGWASGAGAPAARLD
jgi:hypothetical protein